MSYYLKEYFASPAFDKSGEGELGSHSIRKLASTYAASCCCTINEIEVRGRWKGEGRKQVHTYVSTTLPYPDAKVAAALCVGGPIKYVLKEGYGISEQFICGVVVPLISRRFGKELAYTLGVPLLWGLMDKDFQKLLPVQYVQFVTHQYSKQAKQ